MPPIEVPPLRPRAAIDLRQARPATERTQTTPQGELAAPAVEVSTPAGGQPPIDHSRVEVIRKAIEEGRYPVIPMRVADALIASGLLLRSGK